MLELVLLPFLALCPLLQHVPPSAGGPAGDKAGHASPTASGAPLAGPDVLEGGRPGSQALLVALHGGSFSGVDAAHLAERCRDELSAAARQEGLRLLVPVAPESERSTTGAFRVPWLSAAGEACVLALIDAELKAHRADPARIVLAGHGAGATGALLLAARHPERFAAVAAWAGTPEPLWDGDRRVIGIADDPVPALADMPIFLWSARDDPYLDRDTWALFTRELQAQRTTRSTGRSAGRAVPRAPFVLLEEDAGGHGYGAQGPGPGLHFLRGQRRARSP